METESSFEGHIARRGQLTARIQKAKTEKSALNILLHEYMPFIKKCVAGVFFKSRSKEDNLTCAMLAFAQSVQTYSSESGAFVPYAQAVIRNSLLNEANKERRVQKHRAQQGGDEAEDGQWESEIARRNYETAVLRENLRTEIEDINKAFEAWGFTVDDLIICRPKQDRSRKTCQTIARAALMDGELVADMLRSRTLPVTRLAALTGFSQKVFEKYRRYIAALILIMTGDYPYIRSFLPRMEPEGKQ
jgi:RNA polymerase sigma factor